MSHYSKALGYVLGRQNLHIWLVGLGFGIWSWEFELTRAESKREQVHRYLTKVLF